MGRDEELIPHPSLHSLYHNGQGGINCSGDRCIRTIIFVARLAYNFGGGNYYNSAYFNDDGEKSC